MISSVASTCHPRSDLSYVLYIPEKVITVTTRDPVAGFE